MKNPKELTHEELIVFELAELDELINKICYFYQFYDSRYYVTDKWTAKDVLAHLVSWHENFATILVATTVELRPKVFGEQLHKVNESEVSRRKSLNHEKLIQQLQDAQKVVKTLSKGPNLGLLPYKKGAEPIEFVAYLQMINKHFKKHFEEVQINYP